MRFCDVAATPMFDLGRALRRSGERQRLFGGDRTGPRQFRLPRDIAGIQRDQNIADTHSVSGLDAYRGNRRDDSTRDRRGFLCGNNAAGFEPLGGVDRRNRNNHDRNGRSCLRLGTVFVRAAGGETSRQQTEQGDSNQSIHDLTSLTPSYSRPSARSSATVCRITKNNLEAAEEMVRQLRLRDIGGIIVVDFIDMVLESNRDLVLRRLVECLGRDRTRHQVAEVTSLGLIQMTRKRIGTGLLEAFSETCDHCQGRGVVVQHEPVEPRKQQDDEPRRGRRGRNRGDNDDSGNGSGNGNGAGNGSGGAKASPSPKDIAAMARHEPKPVETGTVPRSSPARRPRQRPTPPRRCRARDPGRRAGPGRRRGRGRRPGRRRPDLGPDHPGAPGRARPRDARGRDPVAETPRGRDPRGRDARGRDPRGRDAGPRPSYRQVRAWSPRRAVAWPVARPARPPAPPGRR